jgi:hypothetical protein
MFLKFIRIFIYCKNINNSYIKLFFTFSLSKSIKKLSCLIKINNI